MSLFSGAAQGTDAHVQQSWLQHSHRLEGQTPHWCSFCSSSGPWQMKLCSGKFSAALPLPSVLAHPRCSEREENELPKRRPCDSFCLWAWNRPGGRSGGHRGICRLWLLISLHGDQQGNVCYSSAENSTRTMLHSSRCHGQPDPPGPPRVLISC